MSNRHLSIVRGMDIKGTARAVLSVLADRANDKGVCWPGISKIAKESGYCRSTVKTALASLREAGLISWVQRCGDDGNLTSNIYTLTLGRAGDNLPRAGDTLPLGQELTHPRAGADHKASIEASSRSIIKESPPALSLPHGKSFADAWRRWERHRKELKKPLKPTMTEGQLANLAKMSEPEAVAMIEHTITMGWQGLRAPDRTSGKLAHREEKKANEYSETIKLKML